MKKIKTLAALSLMELIISLSIVAILSYVSFSSLANVKVGYRRKEAQSELIKLKSSIQEEAVKYGCSMVDIANWLNSGSSSGITACTSLPTTVSMPQTPNGYYTLTAPVDSNHNIILTATPTAGGPQAKDTSCPLITLCLPPDGSDSIQGAPTSTSSTPCAISPNPDPNKCWQ